jgi:hypothetical protein
VPLVLGTSAGAGIPPSAALSPGIPSSGGDANAPPAHIGCRHPNISHPGSSCATSDMDTSGRPARGGVVFAATIAPITAIPPIAVATAVPVSVTRTPEPIAELNVAPSGMTQARKNPFLCAFHA